MKLSELIKQLVDFDMDLEVFIEVNGEEEYPIESINKPWNTRGKLIIAIEGVAVSDE